MQTLGMCRSQTFGYDLNADVKVCAECRHSGWRGVGGADIRYVSKSDIRV